MSTFPGSGKGGTLDTTRPHPSSLTPFCRFIDEKRERAERWIEVDVIRSVWIEKRWRRREWEHGASTRHCEMLSC